MQNVLFVNSDMSVKADVSILTDNLIKIEGDVEKNMSGFLLLDDEDNVFGRYEKFTTLYKEVDGGFILSNDGSVYVEPEPEPEPYIPTLEEVQEEKVLAMNAAKEQAILMGVDITLSNGMTKHFPLTDSDQKELLGLQSKILAGEEKIQWHTSDESEHCEFYSNADMAIITKTALEYITWHKTYFRDLRIYIRSLSDKEEVEAIDYGVNIPEEYQSEPLKETMAARQL